MKKLNSKFCISNAFAKIVFDEANPNYVNIQLDGIFLELLIPSGTDTIHQWDKIQNYISCSKISNENSVGLVFKYKSLLWREKQYFLILYSDYLEYYYTFKGCGKLDTIRFFETIFEHKYNKSNNHLKFLSDISNDDYRHFRSATKTSFRNVFSPEVNLYCKYLFDSCQNAQISANSDLDYFGGNFSSSPPLFSFLFSNSNNRWYTFGLVTKQFQHHFTEYHYNGGAQFGLSLNYWGYPINGEKFITPKLIICSGINISKTFSSYVNILMAGENYLSADSKKKPFWWREPIICGYGHQSYTTDLFRVRSCPERPRDMSTYHACTQNFYENFVRLIDQHNLPWRSLIIDARWFLNGGVKFVDSARWPNMRKFIDRLHQRKKKVILWWSFWERDGINLDNCITLNTRNQGIRKNRDGRFQKFGGIHNGGKIAPDYTLEATQKDQASVLYKALSSDRDCMNADGLKIDHVAGLPGFYGMEFPERSKRLRGIEYLKFVYQFVYDVAKSIKPDALITGQSPNPYFSGCFDAIRLGDSYTPNYTITEEMKLRATLARIALPRILIEVDGWPIPNLLSLENFSNVQGEIGTPCLYYASHIDTTGEEITCSTFAKIRENWNAYNQGIKSDDQE